jgi:hypothetical protein
MADAAVILACRCCCMPVSLHCSCNLPGSNLPPPLRPTRRGRGEMIRIAYAYKGIELDEVAVDFAAMKGCGPEYPFGQCPRLVDGAVDAVQSNAIVRWVRAANGSPAGSPGHPCPHLAAAAHAGGAPRSASPRGQSARRPGPPPAAAPAAPPQVHRARVRPLRLQQRRGDPDRRGHRGRRGGEGRGRGGGRLPAPASSLPWLLLLLLLLPSALHALAPGCRQPCKRVRAPSRAQPARRASTQQLPTPAPPPVSISL